VLRVCELFGTVVGNLSLPFVENLVYSLRGGVRVGRDLGATGALPGGAQGVLLIAPGVTVFGSSGSDYLVVTRGSQLFAEGTATRPIIMTSRQNLLGTSTDTSIGQWGGLLLAGRAPNSRCISAGAVGGSVDCEQRIEGAGDLYGGASPTDTSGRLRYLQVRFAGFEVAPGNELNGITLGGVGSGTTFENIQVHNGSDDGIEWFGGTVNGRYLVVTGADDDSLDTDNGYRGLNQFILVIQRAQATSSNHAVEADSTGNDPLRPRSRPSFASFTFIHRNNNASNASHAVMLRGGTDFNFYNGIIRSPSACVEFREAPTIRAADAAQDDTGVPNFRSVHMACTQGAAFGSSGVTTADVTTVLSEAGRNNVLTGTDSLTGTFFPGAQELAVPAFAAQSVNSFFTPVTYVGAFRDANDTWFNGWTCGLGGTTPSCTVPPLPIP
jgi:hypothetical protein